MLPYLMLAAISGQGLVWAVVWVLIAGVIFWLVDWLIRYVGVPEPFAKVARIMLAIIAVIILINALLTLAGHPFITW